jgi:hypothetical protein
VLVDSPNLELVRSIVAAWERGDFSSADWADPEIDFVVADGVEPDNYRGLTGMANAWRSRMSAYEAARLQPDEYRELDDGRVLVFYRAKGRGKTSGLDLEKVWTKGAMVFQIRSDKVTRLVVYNDAARAVRDLA